MAQNHRPLIKDWAKSFGGSSTEEAYTIIQTDNGGYVFAGRAHSSDGQLAGNPSNQHKWIVRTDAFGNILWKKSYGNYGSAVYSIIQTADGGFAATGSSVPAANPSQDDNFWIIKLDANGNKEWEKVYGGTLQELAYKIIQTPDGGYAVAGFSSSFDGDITDKPFVPGYMNDYWVIRLNASGNMIWSKSLGGKNSDICHDIISTYDGGLLVAGECNSIDYDVTDHKGNGSNYWIVKLDDLGNIKWSKSYGGGNGKVAASSIKQLSDSGYVIGGIASVNGGDITDNHGGGQFDYWVVRTDSIGTLQWAKSYGGTGSDYMYELIASRFGGFVMIGTSNSTDGDNIDPKGMVDYWVVRTDALGNIEWTKSYGGSQVDIGTAVFETADGGLVLAGTSSSTNGDVTDHIGGSDSWIVKLHYRIETLPLNSLTYCAGDSIQVATRLYGKFNSNNAFVVELSGANGSFTAPDTVGYFSNNNTDSVFSIKLPDNLTGGTQYRIRVASTSPTAEYFDNGQYITIRPKPLLNGVYGNTSFLGADTALCSNETLLLQAPPVTGYRYKWQDNSTGNQYTVSFAGQFHVQVRNQYGCSTNDTIQVNYKASPVFTLGNDTTICQGAALNLQPVVPSGSYLWNTGSTQPSVQLNTAGAYWLKVTEAGCSTYDTLQLAIQSLPVVNLGKDTVLCEGETLLLDAIQNNGSTYLWQDGSVHSTFLVDKPGNYTVSVDQHGCSAGDEIAVTYRTLPQITFGNDTTLCMGETLVLDVAQPDAVYAWSTGSGNSMITVNNAGVYRISITNNCGVAEDSIKVNYENCSCTVSIPTAFTPNHDGKNDIFKPLSKCQLNAYQLKIFNRWGQVIFSSVSQQHGWNGSYNNVLQASGNYVYILQYKDAVTGKTIVQRGSVYLLR